MLPSCPILSLRDTFGGPDEGEPLEHIDVLMALPRVPPHAVPGSAHEASWHPGHPLGASYPVPLAPVGVAAPPIVNRPPPSLREKRDARLLYTGPTQGDVTLVGTLGMGERDIAGEPNDAVAPSPQAPVGAPIKSA